MIDLLKALSGLRARWEREAGASVDRILIPAQLALLDVMEVLGAHPDEYAQVLPQSNPGCSLPLYLVAGPMPKAGLERLSEPSITAEELERLTEPPTTLERLAEAARRLPIEELRALVEMLERLSGDGAEEPV